MATNSTSFDLVTDLLSTNNTINVATLVGATLFGILAVYACYLTWRHQLWERQLEEERAARRTDDLETGSPANAYAMRDLNPGSNDETVVEEGPDAASTGGRSNQLAPSFVPFGEHITIGRTAREDIVDGGAGGTSDIPGNAGASLEGEASRPPSVTGNQIVSMPHNALDGSMLENGSNGIEASVGGSETISPFPVRTLVR